jgi:hypothetical protein
MGIAAIVIGIIVSVVYCKKKKAMQVNGNYQQFQN